MTYPEVIKRIAQELKAHDFDALWVSSTTWNALKATTDGHSAQQLTEVDGEYAIRLITCGRKIHVFCDPALEDDDVVTADNDDEETDDV